MIKFKEKGDYMKLKLIDFYELREQLPKVIDNDLSKIIESMETENILLDGWELVEVPYDRTYLFFNKSMNGAFDIESDENNVLVPHYYAALQNSWITKHSTSTIQESIKKYKLN